MVDQTPGGLPPRPDRLFAVPDPSGAMPAVAPDDTPGSPPPIPPVTPPNPVGEEPEDLARRLSRVERNLSDIAHALGRLVPAVDTVRGLVVDELASMQHDLRRTAAIVDSFSGTLDAEVASLADRAEEVGRTYASGALDRSLELHLADFADQVRAGTNRLVTRAEEDRDTLAGALAEVLRAELQAATGHLHGVRDPEAVVTEALEGMRATLESALAAQANRVEGVLGGTRADVLAGAAEVRHAATAVRDAVTDELARSRDLTADRLARAEQDATTLLEQVRAQVATLQSEADDRTDQVRTAMVASVAPIEALSGAVEALHGLVGDVERQSRSNREVVAQLSERVAALAAETTAGMQAFRDDLRSDTERLRDDLRATATTAAEQLDGAVDAVSVRFAGEAGQRLDELAATLEALVQDATERQRRAALDEAQRMESAATRMDGAAGAVDALQRSLVEYLAERDRRAAIERAELVQSFVEQLAGGLTRRDRRRLARHIEPPDTGPDEQVAERLAEVLARSSGTLVRVDEPASPAPGRRVAVTEPATPDQQGDEASDPATAAMVRPPRRARPVRRVVSAPSEATDPAAVRRRLATVRGLGPSRQSELIDRFGSIEGLRAASDEDLLAVPGVGPALLAAIRDAVA